VPATPSSLITVLSSCAGSAAAPPEAEPDTGRDADLLAVLAEVPDPRAARGCRHRLVTVLAVAVAAVLAGASSFLAIAERANDLSVAARHRAGAEHRARPHTS